MRRLGLALLAGLSFNAVAATTTTTATDVIRSTVNESEMNRMDQKYQITLNSGIAYSLPGSGIKAAMFLDENRMLELNYINSVDRDTEDSYGYTEKPMYDLSIIEVSYKQFNGNSFYFQPTAYYRNGSTVNSITSSYSGNELISKEYDGDVTFSDVGLGIKIGNQWQWDNFTIGCDWVGISKSVTTLAKSGDGSSDLTDGNNLSLLNLYLGASF